MLRANTARVEFDQAHKRWEVHIHVGAEVIKRPISDSAAGSGDSALTQLAVQTARDEGYELDPANVEIVPSPEHAA
ncbi:MAG TPA: hypothetical protein VG456_11540 [Candidatus Sulfopaludibacter sp.]|jgi:hypothetical protein|nr:hypothetical protein [Candidatus Sulfopaludibacter sp.]